MTDLYRGANILLRRPLFAADGTTPIDPVTLLSVECRLIQHGQTRKVLTRGVDPELRNGTDNESLTLELTSGITDSLEDGDLTEQYKITVTEAGFVAEPGIGVYIVVVTEINLKS